MDRYRAANHSFTSTDLEDIELIVFLRYKFSFVTELSSNSRTFHLMSKSCAALVPCVEVSYTSFSYYLFFKWKVLVIISYQYSKIVLETEEIIFLFKQMQGSIKFVNFLIDGQDQINY